MKQNEQLPIRTEIFAVLDRGDGTREVYEGHNAITTYGLTYYAQKAAGESITNSATSPDFTNTSTTQATWTDGTVAIAVGNDYGDISADVVQDSNPADTSVTINGSYPQTDDGDTDNPGTPGPTVVTYKFNWPSGANTDFSGAKDIVVHHSGATGAGHELLCHAEVDAAGISKGTSDSLTLYINHTFA